MTRFSKLHLFFLQDDNLFPAKVYLNQIRLFKEEKSFSLFDKNYQLFYNISSRVCVIGLNKFEVPTDAGVSCFILPSNDKTITILAFFNPDYD